MKKAKTPSLELSSLATKCLLNIGPKWTMDSCAFPPTFSRDLQGLVGPLFLADPARFLGAVSTLVTDLIDDDQDADARLDATAKMLVLTARAYRMGWRCLEMVHSSCSKTIEEMEAKG